MILIFNNRLYNEQVNPRKNINMYFIAVKEKATLFLEIKTIECYYQIFIN